MEINKIYNEKAEIFLKKLPDCFIDLTVTSPPYDDIRKYKGFTWDINIVAPELFRTTKKGGVCVWVVSDQTKNGSETGSSFKQALKFMECGWNLHDTMIYQKLSGLPLNHNRYEQDFEYMFVFSKGKPKTFNPIRIKTTTNEKRNSFFPEHDEKNNKRRSGAKRTDTKPDKIKGNIWGYRTGLYHSTSDKIAFKHPAVFPEKLVADHIKSWTNEGDLVYDCFMGSGTTAKVAVIMNRNYIGSEMTKDYVDVAELRLQSYANTLFNGFEKTEARGGKIIKTV